MGEMLLHIKATKNSPEVRCSYDEEKFVLNISGNSFPENAKDYYSRITNYIISFDKKVSSFVVNSDISYLASSSMINFLDLLKTSESKFGSGNCVLNWNFESDDDDSEKTGDDFAKILSMKVNSYPY